jgi:hypothetical protein
MDYACEDEFVECNNDTLNTQFYDSKYVQT